MIHYTKKTRVRKRQIFSFSLTHTYIKRNKTVMSSLSYPQEPNSQIHHISLNSIISENDNEDFLDDDDDDDSYDQSNESIDKSTNKKQNKKTLGRVKIKMAYIDNKIRRYTTFSKRKTGIMKKAYELATLTGTEVMLLVASETGKYKRNVLILKQKFFFHQLGHVYTYATPKLQPMITSETGKALIQTCLAKDESIIESSSITTTLNNNDVILIDENQRKKRTNVSDDGKDFFFLLCISIYFQ
jgi:serum response factor